jgi:hypothetical protein
LNIRRRIWAGGLILTISLALVITAHNLTALTVSALVAAAALVMYPPVENQRRLWNVIIASIGLSFALAAFFWVPAIYYVPLVKSDQLLIGKFDFHNNFQPLGGFVWVR